MEHVTELGKLLAVMAISVLLGLSLVRLCLIAAFRLMPAHPQNQDAAAKAAATNSRAGFRLVEGPGTLRLVPAGSQASRAELR